MIHDPIAITRLRDPSPDCHHLIACQVGERFMLKDSVGVDNWHAYLAEMEQHGRTWGDEATLLAMSVWLDCPSTAPLHANKVPTMARSFPAGAL